MPEIRAKYLHVGCFRRVKNVEISNRMRKIGKNIPVLYLRTPRHAGLFS